MKVKESRNYIVPLRRAWLKTPRWRRSKKAISALREFLLKHTKADEINISRWINELIWSHGGKNPPAKVTVKIEMKEEEIGKGSKKRTIKVAYADLTILPARAKRIDEKKKAEASKRKAKKEAGKGVMEKMKSAVEEATKEKEVKEEKKEHKCEFCEETFDSRSALKMHTQDEHKSELQKKKQAQVTKAQELGMNK